MAKRERRLAKKRSDGDSEAEGSSVQKRDRSKDSSVIYKTGEMPRMRGGGVAKNLAITISSAIALIMVVVAIVMIILVSGAIDSQIDAGGVAAARLLAAVDLEIWKKNYGLDRVELEEDKAKMTHFNQHRLARVLEGPTPILNATIYRKDKLGSATIRRDGRDPKMRGDPPQFKASGKGYEEGDVTVEYGYIAIDKKVYDGRSYLAPIKDFRGDVIGLSRVVMSEDEITDQKWSLAGTMALMFVIFIALGIVIATFLGKKITKPIKHLIEDVTKVAEGDMAHHTSPQSQDEIGLLARTFDKMTKNLNDAQAKEIELASQRHQMAIAQEVQTNLLPDKIPQVPGYEIVAYHRSSKEVDGNYYDVIQYPDGKVGLLVATASGKGIPAAMVMTMARSFFRAFIGMGKDPAELLKESNRLLSPDLRAGMYVEVLMVLVDPATQKAKLVSAGPTSLYRYSFADKKMQRIHADGIALGFDKGPIFDKSIKDVEFELAPGDRLVLNAPGVFTIKSLDGVELGDMGFAKAVNKHATKSSEAFVHQVVSILDNYAGMEVSDTDITILTLRRLES